MEQRSKTASHQLWLATSLGVVTGALGGAVQSKVLDEPISHGVLLGALFGLIFALAFAKRATTPGAGLIWGLAAGLLLWFVIPAEIDAFRLGSARSANMLNDARQRFPQLVAYLVCLGMPVGLVLGIQGGLRPGSGQTKFRWGRAIVAGGIAGVVSGLAFSGWEY